MFSDGTSIADYYRQSFENIKSYILREDDATII